MTHAETLVGSLHDSEKTYWARAHNTPRPKVFGGFIEAWFINNALKKIAEEKQKSTPLLFKEDIEPTDEETGKKKKPFAVSTAAVNFNLVAGYDEDSWRTLFKEKTGRERIMQPMERERKIQDECNTALAELHVLGIPAIYVGRPMNVDGDKFLHYYQHSIEIPRKKLEKEIINGKEEIVERFDFETQVLFLAYMLHKGYVTKDDIPQMNPMDERQEMAIPYGQMMLKFALSPKYQNKVRAALGEPLLPAEGVIR